MTDVRETGINVFRELLPGVIPDGNVNLRGEGFGSELMELTCSARCGGERA